MTKDPQLLTNGSKQLPGIDRNQLTEKMLEGEQPRTGPDATVETANFVFRKLLSRWVSVCCTDLGLSAVSGVAC